MSWWCKEPGHQHPWYWLCWTKIIRSPHVKGQISFKLTKHNLYLTVLGNLWGVFCDLKVSSTSSIYNCCAWCYIFILCTISLWNWAGLTDLLLFSPLVFPVGDWLSSKFETWVSYLKGVADSKVHGAKMGPIWGRQDPGGRHIGPMNFAIWGTMVIND